MKTKALGLADILEKMPLGECDKEAADELRRLHQENELNKALVAEAQEMAIQLSGVNKELLEALKTVMGDVNHGQDRFKQARAAIAKAEGEKQ